MNAFRKIYRPFYVQTYLVDTVVEVLSRHTQYHYFSSSHVTRKVDHILERQPLKSMHRYPLNLVHL